MGAHTLPGLPCRAQRGPLGILPAPVGRQLPRRQTYFGCFAQTYFGRNVRQHLTRFLRTLCQASKTAFRVARTARALSEFLAARTCAFYPTCCPLVRFSHMLRATGHARMVNARHAGLTMDKRTLRAARCSNQSPSRAPRAVTRGA